MKFVVLLLVLVGVFWWMFGRRGKPPAKPPTRPPEAPTSASRGPSSPSASSAQSGTGTQPQIMVACAHCGLHLPRSDAVLDTQGRGFCGAAHRLAGPSAR
jgi:uncharacterized protein